MDEALMARKELDWSKTGTVCAMAKWIRENSDGLAVFVIQRDVCVLATDPRMPAKDIGDLVMEYLPQIVEAVPASRAKKEDAARLVLESIEE
jgi:hypothetical protein